MFVTNNNESAIKIKTEVEKKRIRYKLVIPSRLERYFIRRSFAIEYKEYRNDMIDLSPDNTLITIPVVGVIFPLALITKTPIYIDYLDEEFYRTLKTTVTVIRSMYPQVPEEFNIFTSLRKTIHSLDNNSFLFYSGGLDSSLLLYTYYKERPYLVTIQGSDRYSHMYHYADINLAIKACEQLNCKDNILIYFENPLNIPYLDIMFRHILTGAIGWYSGIQVGIMLPTLVAPISSIYRCSTIYIANATTIQKGGRSSDNKDVYESIRYGNVKTVSPHGELSRVEKINRLGILSQNLPLLPIRSCLRYHLHNCNQCEKCIRTMLSLMIAGLDPVDFGFNFSLTNLEEFIEHIKKKGISTMSKAIWKEIITASHKLDDKSILTTLDRLNSVIELKSHEEHRQTNNRYTFDYRLYSIYSRLPLTIREKISNIIIPPIVRRRLKVAR